jgi:ABC-2 type transport system ATP-binding protein
MIDEASGTHTADTEPRPTADADRKGRIAEPAVAVRVDHLSIRLELQKEKVTSLREHAVRLLQRKPVETEEFWPVRNVSFAVRQGEVFGIVGRNGAGKSTLLKAIAGVLRPTKGRVEVMGRVAPLLELGAGFDSEMTGRENVFLYGSLLGFPRRDLVDRFDRIVTFAELEEFIDVPLKNYSSGMATRLGFAIAIDVDADVLIVDEALTVGDSRFQLKCMERIEDFRRRGATILFVSHNTEQLRRLCTRTLWIDNGVVRMEGETDQVVAAYASDEFEPSTQHLVFDEPADVDPPAEPLERRLAREEQMRDILLGSYDFIDVAKVISGSTVYAAGAFGGTGVGLTDDPKVADVMRRHGFEAVVTDLVEADFPENFVSYVSFLDCLQYLGSPELVEAMLSLSSIWARDFIVMRFPSYEDEEYLKHLGLKRYWEHWSAAPYHIRLPQLTSMLHSLGLDRASVIYRRPTLSSDSPSILPASAPPDQSEYDPLLHGPKPHVTFPRPVYEQVDVYVPLREFDRSEWREIIHVSLVT